MRCIEQGVQARLSLLHRPQPAISQAGRPGILSGAVPGGVPPGGLPARREAAVYLSAWPPRLLPPVRDQKQQTDGSESAGHRAGDGSGNPVSEAGHRRGA